MGFVQLGFIAHQKLLQLPQQQLEIQKKFIIFISCATKMVKFFTSVYLATSGVNVNHYDPFLATAITID